MLDVPLIKKLFRALNEELKKQEIIGEIGICGGASMCLVFQARESTKDVDGIFAPTGEMRKASRQVAKQYGLDENWLNDAAKAYFHVDPPREAVLQFSNLRVWSPRGDYLLAMKCIAARFDTSDRDDVVFLIKYLKLAQPEQVYSLVEKYYPRLQVPAKTKFLIEEIFQIHYSNSS